MTDSKTKRFRFFVAASLLLIASGPGDVWAQSTVCADQVQGRIAWDYRGSRSWSPVNVQRLCAGAEDSTAPARCFQRVMHGGVEHGGTGWTWQQALSLCAGTRDADATVRCFETRRDSGLATAAAIDSCRWDRSSPPMAPPTSLISLAGLSVNDAIRIAAPPTLRHQINVVEHLCINTECELGDQGWDKTDSQMRYDGTDETTFEVDVPGSRFVRLCPVRRRTTDREFGGNGPAVRANSSIEQHGDVLRLSAFMEAEETGRGSSLAFRTWRGDLYTAPDGWSIVGFTPERSETSYTDRNHEEDTPPVRGGSLVSEFRFKGDTGGDDIGNCTTDDTYMTLTFNPVTVTLRADRADLRSVRIPEGLWTGVLRTALTRLRIKINNYDRAKSQPENGTAENKYFIDRTDPRTWSRLTDAEIRQASHFSYRRSPRGGGGIDPTPFPVPAIRRNTFTFLLNDINLLPALTTVEAASDHIRITLPFESREAEVVAACVDNIACGTGEPHEAGKPLVQVDNLRILPYLRPRVDRRGGSTMIRAELSRVRMEADIARDGTCRDNAFAWACGAFAGNIERIAYNAILEQLNRFVANSAELTGLLDDQLTAGVCGLLGGMGESCDAVENIVLGENGDLLLWLRG